MTINQLLRQSGVPFTRRDATELGEKVKRAAKEKGYRYTKKEELIPVNDYPPEFQEEMITIAINHFTAKTNKK